MPGSGRTAKMIMIVVAVVVIAGMVAAMVFAPSVAS